MKTIEQFKEYCMQEMGSDLHLLGKIRRSVYVKLTAAGAVASCAGAAFVDHLMRQEYITSTKSICIAVGCIFFTIFLAIVAISVFLTREYKSAFKLSVMYKLVQFLDPKLQYEPAGFVSSGLYGLSNLFRREADRYSGGNYVKGRIGETTLEFSEVLSEYYVKRKGGKSWITIFNGLFFVVELNREYAGQTLVVPDFAENLLGKLGQTLQSMTAPLGQLVKFDDAEFEKYFAVYADNEAGARDALTPGLMGRMIEFRKKNRSNLRFSITGSRIFIAISFNRSPCDAPFFGPILNFSKIGRYLEDIELALGMIEEMNRNTRVQANNRIAAPALL